MVYRIDVPSASATPPAAGTPGVEGYPTNGVPGVTPPTDADAYWFYALCEEIRNVVVAAGLTPTKGNVAQLLAALSQAGPVVGSMRGAYMYVPAASLTASFGAFEIVVAKSLGGLTWKLANFNETINLATTGAGGMDTGITPASGYVGIYAIYNPTTNTAALLAVNATSAVVPPVYGGAHMPAGYIYSALVSVWQTNGSQELIAGNQTDRKITYVAELIVNLLTFGGPAPLSVAGQVPLNAKTIDIFWVANTASATVGSIELQLGSTTGSYFNSIAGMLANFANITQCSDFYQDLPIITPQTIYYEFTGSVSGSAAQIYSIGYSI